MVMQEAGVQDPLPGLCPAAGAGRGSQRCVPGRALQGGGGHGELVAVFLLDVCPNVPGGRSESGYGGVGERSNSRVGGAPLTNPYAPILV